MKVKSKFKKSQIHQHGTLEDALFAWGSDVNYVRNNRTRAIRSESRNATGNRVRTNEPRLKTHHTEILYKMWATLSFTHRVIMEHHYTAPDKPIEQVAKGIGITDIAMYTRILDYIRSKAREEIALND